MAKKAFKANIVDFQTASERNGETFNCYSLSERTVFLLNTMIDSIGWKTRYLKSDWTDAEIAVLDDWRNRAAQELMLLGNCGQEVGYGCRDVPSDSSGLVWYPVNPYIEPDTIPEGYIEPPFDIVDANLLTNLLGFQVGDVLVPFLSLPFFGWSPDLTVPSIRWEFTGKGELEVHLLRIPQGGLAFITIDDNLINTTVIDLSSVALLDFESWIEAIIGIFPQFAGESLFAENITEFQFETDGAHSVEIRFFPKLGGNEILGFGGGFRKLTWCTDMFDNCCPDTNIINMNIYRAEVRAQQQLNRMIDDPEEGTAASFGAPSTFNGDNSDARNWALCRTINRLVRSTFDTMAMGYDLASDVVEFTQRYFPSAQPLAGFFAEITNAITREMLDALSEDCAAMRAVACCLRDGLTGQDTTIENLQSALGDCGFTFGSHEAQIAYMVNSALQSTDNARAFIANMNEDYESAGQQSGASASDCDCDCDCTETIIPVDWYGTGCQFEYVGNCTWRITNSTPYTETPHYQASVADQLGRCFKTSVPDEPYTIQGVADHNVDNCDGTNSTYVGGWVGGCVLKAWWRCGIDEMDTYMKFEIKKLGEEGCP